MTPTERARAAYIARTDRPGHHDPAWEGLSDAMREEFVRRETDVSDDLAWKGLDMGGRAVVQLLQSTPDLRWVVPSHTTTASPVLQQRRINVNDSTHLWLPVPLVVVAESKDGG